MNILNGRFRSEIERIGISKLSRDLGIARNTIYNWCEKGNIPLDKLFLLGENGVDINYVISGTKEAASLTPEETVLVSKYREADFSRKNEILMLLLVGSIGTSNNVANNQNNDVHGQQIGNNNQQDNHFSPTQKTTLNVKNVHGGEVNGIKNVK